MADSASPCPFAPLGQIMIYKDTHSLSSGLMSELFNQVIGGRSTYVVHLNMKMICCSPVAFAEFAMLVPHYTKVQSLNFSSNRMSKRQLGILMEGMTSYMPDLHSLRLSSCGITDQQIPTVMESLKKLRRLAHLDLSHNQVKAKGASIISQHLKEMPSLGYLNLNHNIIGDQGVTDILGNVPVCLSSIELARIKINLSGINALKRSLAETDKLLYLNLSENLLGNEGWNVLIEEINTDLRSLKLNSALLSTQNLGKLKERFADKKLCLSIRNNKIGPSETNIIAEMTNLKKLDISDNPITDKGAKVLVESLKNLKGLTLENTEITVEFIKTIMNDTDQHWKLKQLSLAYNSLDNYSVAPFCKLFPLLGSLKAFNLKGSKFNRHGFDIMSQVFAELKLEELECDFSIQKCKMCRKYCFGIACDGQVEVFFDESTDRFQFEEVDIGVKDLIAKYSPKLTFLSQQRTNKRVWMEILKFMNVPELGKIARLSKAFYNLICKDDEVWNFAYQFQFTHRITVYAEPPRIKAIFMYCYFCHRCEIKGNDVQFRTLYGGYYCEMCYIIGHLDFNRCNYERIRCRKLSMIGKNYCIDHARNI